MKQTHDHRSFAVEVVRRLRDAGHIAYWAGGCVRDLVRGRTPQDYDVATDAKPDTVRNLFGRKRTVAVGEAFGVVVVLPPPGASPVEVATFRSEGPYLDGRRPESVVFSSPEEDAQRRDFTINGMFYDPLEDRILDFVGGRDDLQHGVVRAIGVPEERMREDKLRLLRAVRFAAAFGFDIEAETTRAIRDMASEITVVSVERITQELRKMLAHPERRRAMELCRDLGLMAGVLPEWLAMPGLSDSLEILERLHEPSFPLALAALLLGVPNPASSRRGPSEPGTLGGICRRLRLSNQEGEDCQWLQARRDEPFRSLSMSDAELKRLLAHPLIGELLKFASARAAVQGLDAAAVEHVRHKQGEWSPEEIDPPPLLTGHDLLRAGVRAGPVVRELLDEVRTAQLNSEVATREAAMRWVESRRGAMRPT
ncbi:MAG: CCA tRNA nucleotidyltransferase [Planctomyces sp.]|nr:CCA tRNA nucleotidyltransferase [Planctomyces sp.]